MATSYERFKERIGCKKNNTVYITPYTIEVIMDETRKASQWDKLQYLMSEGKEIKIFMTDPNRTVDELMFDFYREVGKLFLHNKLVDLHKADKYFDKEKLEENFERSIIVEEFSLDEYATIKMNYDFNIVDVLPLWTKSKLKTKNLDTSDIETKLIKKNSEVTARREYLSYIFKANKKNVKLPKSERNVRMDDKYDKPLLEAVPKPEVRKPIRNISKKMSLSDWSNDFTTNMREIIRVYARTPLEELTKDDFVISLKDYIPLDVKPEDWDKPMRYYKHDSDGYHQFKKVPEFIPGLYYKLIEYDEKQVIKELYDEFHSVVSNFVVKYYECYRTSFHIDDRYMYQFIIENGLRDYINMDEVPDNEKIQRLKRQYHESKEHHSGRITVIDPTMMTYKERRTLLDKIICEVALNKHIDKYRVNDGYDLNNQMNNIVSRYLANNNKIDSAIEGMLMPFIIRSSV